VTGREGLGLSPRRRRSAGEHALTITSTGRAGQAITFRSPIEIREAEHRYAFRIGGRRKWTSRPSLDETGSPGSYPSIMDPIRTQRLELIPATAEFVRAEIEDPTCFFARLGVAADDKWPSKTLQEVLPLFLEALQDPANVGWLTWYWVDRAENALVGGGGFKGQPAHDGTVEIGYETRPAYRRRGYASEAIAALVHWVLSQPGVRRVFAETAADNIGSICVLKGTGFTPSGPSSEPGLDGFEFAGNSTQAGTLQAAKRP